MNLDRKMKSIVSIVLLCLAVSCSPVPENTLSKYPDNSDRLELWQRTGHTYFGGPCGFLVRETSRYIISFPENGLQYSYTDISVDRDGSKILLSGGTLQITKPNTVTVKLYERKNGIESPLQINGKHKFR